MPKHESLAQRRLQAEKLLDRFLLERVFSLVVVTMGIIGFGAALVMAFLNYHDTHVFQLWSGTGAGAAGVLVVAGNQSLAIFRKVITAVFAIPASSGESGASEGGGDG